MDKYTPEQFNEAMAKLAGIKYEKYNGKVFVTGMCDMIQDLNYHSDLNQLMPLAWKYKVLCTAMFRSDKQLNTFDEWLNALRDDMWQLAQEKQDD